MKITDAHRKQAFADFEEKGMYQVKEFLERGLYSMNPHYAILAREWLAEKEAAREAPVKEKEWALSKEANEISKESNKIAKDANVLSVWAIVFSVIATVAAIIALFK